jgi:hypothetical protein
MSAQCTRWTLHHARNCSTGLVDAQTEGKYTHVDMSLSSSTTLDLMFWAMSHMVRVMGSSRVTFIYRKSGDGSGFHVNQASTRREYAV